MLIKKLLFVIIYCISIIFIYILNNFGYISEDLYNIDFDNIIINSNMPIKKKRYPNHKKN